MIRTYLIFGSIEFRPGESILLLPGRGGGEERGGEGSLVKGEVVGQVLFEDVAPVCWSTAKSVRNIELYNTGTSRYGT